ncbi:lysozyme inhibitor [Bacteroides sp. 51]|uniref:lysozyme inhibitor n=1 Tax=Bacteroides sp. 51 TaxID=2302938 RepID=UPI0013D7A694|nr:lysozyme inhibitor [Bacteroides sp. 51]
MKKVFFVLTMMTGVFVFTSCNQKAKEAVVEEVTVVTANQEAGIVKNSVTDKSGTTMYLTFNNPRGLVDIVLKGDTITLMQDTTASGIKFTNAEYVYEEWQGKVTLKKDGSIVFEK